ncbi:M67 family metallopeptidase [Phormidium sp. LEGE 05292]|uniref:Mov34/MPN/PAD-1 family protein n=1 Tax=[Phormidium] sp. LEGE 05292 TaxID=767427 RepID=UPI00187EBC44|nr:M67 family metallopeptidase [Phormidium sp. LEGE 05292]MBE9227428.1 M67 family metallopeptidase [Phormidium sp. LEGE 05292]
MIKIPAEHLQAICTHAERTYPEECCGIMLGKIGDEGKTVSEVWETFNAWEEEKWAEFPASGGVRGKESTFTIAPLDIIKAQKVARDRQLQIIGFYHSHPDHPAIPSEMDRAIAWAVYSYIIVSVRQGKVGEVRSWCLDDAHQFQEEEIFPNV